jgi:hypothetical protein
MSDSAGIENDIVGKMLARRSQSAERLKPVVAMAVRNFEAALMAVLGPMQKEDRQTLLSRADGFFSEALNIAVKDLVLTCIFPTSEERVNRALEDFMLFRACYAVTKRKTA